MKTKIIISTLMLTACTLLTGNICAQNYSEISEAEDHRMDSTRATEKSHQLETQKMKDETRMAEVKRDRRQSKTKAVEAQRVEREASAAARESNNAYKTEKRAQKARRQADKQALKASRANSKSDAN